MGGCDRNFCINEDLIDLKKESGNNPMKSPSNIRFQNANSAQIYFCKCYYQLAAKNASYEYFQITHNS